MKFEAPLSKVYILMDADGRITRIEGGYSEHNISNFSEWLLIDEGYGDRYNLCQSNYLPKPLTDDRGIFRYKWNGKKIVERTEEEMAADVVGANSAPPTQEERIREMEAQNEMLMECLLEISEIIYA